MLFIRGLYCLRSLFDILRIEFVISSTEKGEKAQFKLVNCIRIFVIDNLLRKPLFFRIRNTYIYTLNAPQRTNRDPRGIFKILSNNFGLFSPSKRNDPIVQHERR